VVVGIKTSVGITVSGVLDDMTNFETVGIPAIDEF